MVVKERKKINGVVTSRGLANEEREKKQQSTKWSILFR
jgi:hypothetical protein